MPNEVPQTDTIIIPPGRPRLLQLESIVKKIIIVTPVELMVRVRRHWNAQEHRRRLCECQPECDTSATDTFATVYEWVGPLTWEQRVWAIPEACFATLQREVIFRRKTNELAGTKWAVKRNGEGPSSRIIPIYDGAGTCKSKGFDLHSAVQSITQISVSFFGKVSTEPECPNIDQIVTPIRARIGSMPRGESSSSNGKPRLPLGKPQKK